MVFGTAVTHRTRVRLCRHSAGMRADPSRSCRLLEGLAAPVDFASSLQGHLDIRTDVFSADVLFEFRLPHEAGRLRLGAAKDQLSTGRVEPVGKVLECQETGGVQGCHIPQPQDHDRRKFEDTVCDHRKLLGGAEEERAPNAEHG